MAMYGSLWFSPSRLPRVSPAMHAPDFQRIPIHPNAPSLPRLLTSRLLLWHPTLPPASLARTCPLDDPSASPSPGRAGAGLQPHIRGPCHARGKEEIRGEWGRSRARVVEGRGVRSAGGDGKRNGNGLGCGWGGGGRASVDSRGKRIEASGRPQYGAGAGAGDDAGSVIKARGRRQADFSVAEGAMARKGPGVGGGVGVTVRRFESSTPADAGASIGEGVSGTGHGSDCAAFSGGAAGVRGDGGVADNPGAPPPMRSFELLMMSASEAVACVLVQSAGAGSAAVFVVSIETGNEGSRGRV
ncbi:hypothetical protein R3P38DRAFT_3206356 [Favolaschia claudopus]|uniref:Uncharacterized protein n=1 Tax=Favolaschia claudopus TaxID=2862362 RepID=A0AAW0ALH5_9AGAR